jgi:hypothetical protein
MQHDPFDVEKFRWRGAKPESNPNTTPKRKRSKPRPEQRATFYQVPLAWHDALEGANAGGKVWAVAGRLLYADFRAYDEWFKLSNVKLRGRVSHDTKTRALELLERLGLIEVKRKDRKSPKIRLLVRR